MNTALRHFQDGGLGMFPTLFFGLILLAVAGFYAIRPERRLVPLLVTLNLLTLSAGALGFVTGVITTASALETVPAGQTSLIALLGVGESLNNVAFALLFLATAAIAATLGAWKIARQAPGVAAAG